MCRLKPAIMLVAGLLFILMVKKKLRLPYNGAMFHDFDCAFCSYAYTHLWSFVVVFDSMITCSITRSSVLYCRLQSLCMQRHGFPFPMPLLVHPPHMTKYPWGMEPYPPGCVTKVGTCHFMQPNSLEFGSAQEWRALELFVLDKKDAMLRSHEEELASVLQAYAEVSPCNMKCTHAYVVKKLEFVL